MASRVGRNNFERDKIGETALEPPSRYLPSVLAELRAPHAPSPFPTSTRVPAAFFSGQSPDLIAFSLMASSGGSWSSAPASAGFAPSQLNPSPTPSLPSSSSKSSEDQIPLSQRRVTGRVPARGPPAAAHPPPKVLGETPEEASSTVTGQDLANLRVQYGIPRGTRLFIPPRMIG